MDDTLGCSTRSFAIAGLVTYGLTVVLIALTLKHPRVGAPSPGSGDFIRLPPQALLAGMLGLFTFGVSVMLVLVCTQHSVANRRWAWLCVLSVSILAALQGPAFLVIHPHFTTSGWNAVALISALGLLLTLLTSLVYSLRSPSG